MGKLIKEVFDLWVRKRWLKTIDKECDEYNKLNAKLRRQGYVVNKLVDRYNEIYKENPIDRSDDGGRGNNT